MLDFVIRWDALQALVPELAWPKQTLASFPDACQPRSHATPQSLSDLHGI
jgi:hypothetical protein